ncbi:hypothetical protein [Nocardia sp. NPDC059239]|uniref:hypothetical protein n=1 Tax=unclassified Nocardia TaxID=2637762 RepID=UPI003678B5E9
MNQMAMNHTAVLHISSEQIAKDASALPSPVRDEHRQQPGNGKGIAAAVGRGLRRAAGGFPEDGRLAALIRAHPSTQRQQQSAADYAPANAVDRRPLWLQPPLFNH